MFKKLKIPPRLQQNFQYLKIPLIITAAAILAACAVLIVFYIRSPVLIIAEESFVLLYGKQRIQDEIAGSSIALFRRVKMVIVANDAGEDIVPHAAAEVSSRPYCVLFPLRFSRSARIYKEQNPDIPIIILAGRSATNLSEFEYVYKTDIENDFKKAGLAAQQIGKSGRIVVFLDYSIERQAREAFIGVLGDERAPEISFYTNFSHYNLLPDLSCAVLAGVGSEFIDQNIEIPIIFISWLNPDLIPLNGVMVINDSPLAQVKEAVRLFSAEEKEGLIGSKIIVPNTKKFNKKILRKIRKIR